MSCLGRDDRKRRVALALAVYVLCTLVFFLFAKPERLHEHTPFNHFALLAESWLEGRLDLGGPPPAYAQTSLYLISQYPSLELRLDIVPEALSYYDIAAFYLPQAPLEVLARDSNPLKGPDVDAALWRRWAAFFLPGAYALLGASLAPVAGTGRVIAPLRILVLALAGYLALVATKVSWAMGEIGVLSGFTSSWLSIVLALVGVIVAQRMLSRPH